MNLAFGFSYGTPFGRATIAPIQQRDEFEAFLGFLQPRAPAAVLEIGTANGGTLFLFCRVAASHAKIVSLDLPGGRFGGGYNEWKVPIFKSFAVSSQEVDLIRGDSHDDRTLRQVEKSLGNRSLDVLFIDGDHSYEGVKKDFETYSKLVREGGLTAFHDIVPGPPENVGGVPRFWAELREGRHTVEFVKDRSQGAYGIGVLFQDEALTSCRYQSVVA